MVTKSCEVKKQDGKKWISNMTMLTVALLAPYPLEKKENSSDTNRHADIPPPPNKEKKKHYSPLKRKLHYFF